MSDPTNLALLTAAQAAAILDVDPKTFRTMQVPYVLAGKSKRYTRFSLQTWLERSFLQWQPTPERLSEGRRGGKSPAKHTSVSVRGRHIGKSASASTIVEFEKALGLKTS